MSRIIEVISAYSNRIIEGVDKGILLEKLKNGFFKSVGSNEHGVIVLLGNQQEVLLDCVCKYFEPIKSYWKLQDKDGCKKKQKAFGIGHCTSCRTCMIRCLEAKVVIKTNKKRR